VKRVKEKVDSLKNMVNKVAQSVEESFNIIKELWESQNCGKNQRTIFCGDSSDDDLFGPTTKTAAKKSHASAPEDSDSNDDIEEDSDLDRKPKAREKNPFIESECEVCCDGGEEDDESCGEQELDDDASPKVARKRKCIVDETTSEGASSGNLAGNSNRSNTKGAKFRKNMKTIYDDDDDDGSDDEDGSDNGRKDESDEDDVTDSSS